jgi:hypothetical protein
LYTCKCSNSCSCWWCSCWWNLDFSFKSYGKESLYKYCMNVDDGRIMRSWRSYLFFMGSVLLIFIVFCVVFLFCFVFILCLVCPMLSVSLEFQFLIASLSCKFRSAGNIWFFFTFVDNDVVVIFVGFVFSFRTILCTLEQII